MPKKRMSRNNPRSKRWLWLGGGLALVAIGAVVWFAATSASTPTPSNTRASDVAANLRNSDFSFNVGTRIGQRAPAFTLLDAQGQSYAFKPGDGRKYVLAFNMGYV